MATTTRRFTVAEVDVMAAIGVFDDGERCELIDGELVTVTPQGPEHSGTLTRLITAFRPYPDERLQVRVQMPLICGDRDLPEPDLAVVVGGPTDFDAGQPLGNQAILVVEVSVTSRAFDQAKAAVYARGGCAAYWLVDVPARRVLVHERPLPDGDWESIQVFGEDAVLDLPQIEAKLSLARLLPRREAVR